MSSITLQPRTPSDRLLGVLSDYRRFLVVMHDNPDPDVIATGWAVLSLIQDKLHRPGRLVGGGAIVRAENRYMVELLNPPIELVTEISADQETAVILVDCGLGTTNHLVTRAAIMPVAVIDHHHHGKGKGRLPFQDIRPTAAAAASIAASYLREQDVDPGMKLATAVLYAIRTETRGYETDHSALDRSVIKWLTGMADLSLLAEIENAPLDPEYYADLVLAMQSTYLYDNAALCFLPRAIGAETVGEVADLLVRCRGVDRVLCAAAIGADLILSVRTSRDCGDAADLLLATVGDLGGSGGHAHRAGGKISLIDMGDQGNETLHEELRRRWLAACGVHRQWGRRLIARREIFKNL